ncbi:MAG: hypothetical protein FWD26_01585 [Treponema sp.]|nr:hypothetical protein [Treponema sp.]
MIVKKIIAVLIFTAIIFGCTDTLTPPGMAENQATGDGGGSGGPVVIPGSGGKTTDTLELNKAYNAGPGKPGMRLVMITQAESFDTSEITTTPALGLWEDDKFHIQGFTTGFGDGFRNQGFVDVAVLYYDQIFEDGEEFTISARIKIKRAGGVSTSKGVHFGAYTNRTLQDAQGNWVERIPSIVTPEGEVIQQWGPNQHTKGLGMFMRAEPSANYRMYYSCSLNSTTAATRPMLPELDGLSLTREYIYVLSRHYSTPAFNTATTPASPTPATLPTYTFKLLDSKTYTSAVRRGLTLDNVYPPPLGLASTVHPVDGTTQISMHPSLRYGVYPGICIAASSVEISQIKVWDKALTDAEWNFALHYMSGDMDDLSAAVAVQDNTSGVLASAARKPIFWTPDTIPAYVPARYIRNHPTFAPALNPVGGLRENVFRYAGTYNELVIAGGNIRITPTREPDFSENTIYYEFFPVSAENHTAFSFVGGDPTGTVFTFDIWDGEKDIHGNDILKTKSTHSRGLINVNLDAITPGTTANGWFKIVGRDLTLETEAIKTSPDYSLLQTLPEYYFKVEVVKPSL